MKKLILIIIMIVGTDYAFGACVHTPQTFNCVEYVRNYDGDTITFNIPNVHPLLGKKISIRVAAIDTPEIRGKTPCEKTLAKKVKSFVRKEMLTAKNIYLDNIKRGKYFRVVADVIYDNKSLTLELEKRGYGYKYFGKTKKKISWCKALTKIH